VSLAQMCTQEVTDQATPHDAGADRRHVAGVGGAAIAGGLIWYFASGPSSGSGSRPATSDRRLRAIDCPGFAGVFARG